MMMLMQTCRRCGRSSRPMLTVVPFVIVTLSRSNFALSLYIQILISMASCLGLRLSYAGPSTCQCHVPAAPVSLQACVPFPLQKYWVCLESQKTWPFSTQNDRFAGAILRPFCIFNRKFNCFWHLYCKSQYGGLGTGGLAFDARPCFIYCDFV